MNEKRTNIYNQIITFWESEKGWYLTNCEKIQYAKGYLTALKNLNNIKEDDEIEIVWDLQEALANMADDQEDNLINKLEEKEK